ncbi:MAG: hypothetical protein JW761_10365 [Prolixibacteraceae bacterium]|nr:hypothetical protein [Prolixibacteraceae bacterium]
MKTKNNVQKAVLRSAAVIVSFVLISFTVSAQEFWKKLLTHSSFNEIAIALMETENKAELPAETGSESTFRFNLVQENDKQLSLEEWMTKDFYFGMSSAQLENETENGLELENWMLNERIFSPENADEKPIELEAWMTSDEVWNS